MNTASIQSFYYKESSLSAPDSRPKRNFPIRDDGSSPSEEAEAFPRPTQPWRPKGVYEQTKIADLQPGPCRVRLTARIVNFSASKDGVKRPMLPQGYHFLVIRDESGAVAVSQSTSISAQLVAIF